MTGQATQDRLFELMGIGSRDLVSFTGAGGKTSLIFHLLDELLAAKGRVLVTTTTKMRYPDDFAGRIFINRSASCIERAFSQVECGGALFAASSRASQGKVEGFTAETVDALFAGMRGAVVLNEADGAAGRPYKYYRDDEPVVPRCTTVHVHVVGCDVLGCVMGDATVHRCPPEACGEVFDLPRFEERMEWFAREKLAEGNARRMLVINKADEGREPCAEAMREAAERHFDASLVTSLKGKRWRA